jgi:hypothetical protein
MPSTSIFRGPREGYTIKSLGTGGATTLTTDQAHPQRLELTGALTSNATVTIPVGSDDAGVNWVIWNNTTGACDVTLSSPGGATILLCRALSCPVTWTGSAWAIVPPQQDAPVPQLPITAPTRTGDAVIGANEATGFNFSVPRLTKVRRIRIRVATQSGALSAAIYDMTRSRLVTSGAVGCGIAGKGMEFALPPTTLQPGNYQLWVSTSDGTASLGINSTYGDLINGEVQASGAHPLPTALTGITLSAQQVCAVALPDDPIGLAPSPVYARTDLGVSVLGQTAGGRLYGSNITTGHYVYSDNHGDTWTDTLKSPSVVTPNVIQLVIDDANSIIYAVTSDGKLYTNTLDTWTSWTDISAPAPAGTTGRQDIFTLNSSYLYYGNYNADPNNPGVGAHIYRSGDGGSTWTAVLDVANGRHVHAIHVDPSNSLHIWASIGDANYAGAGLWYSANGGDTWTHLSGGATSRYGIDFVLPAAVTSVPQRIVFEGDGTSQPHLMCYYNANTTGTTNLTDPLVWYDATPTDGSASWTGTARGIIQDTNGNIFFISTGENGAVGTRYGLWLCRGPWFTTPTLLEELPAAWVNFGKTYESGNYLINYRYRMTRPKFNGQ